MLRHIPAASAADTFTAMKTTVSNRVFQVISMGLAGATVIGLGTLEALIVSFRILFFW
jgi:hypothetical protein